MIARATAAVALLCAAACTGFTTGDNAIAIEFVAPPDTVRVGDTVVIQVRVLARSGDSIPGAPVTLVSLTPDTIGVDSVRQAVFVVNPPAAGVSHGLVTARSGNILSDPLRITVPAPTP